jgi:Ca-activated chloride channel family protein
MHCAGRWLWRWLGAGMLAAVLTAGASAQDNPLENPNTAAPPPKPKDTRPVLTGGSDIAAKATSARGSAIRINVNLVLVPVTVTDPSNRLVTGLEKENFQLYENNTGETIKLHAGQVQPGAPCADRVSAHL